MRVISPERYGADGVEWSRATVRCRGAASVEYMLMPPAGGPRGVGLQGGRERLTVSGPLDLPLRGFAAPECARASAWVMRKIEEWSRGASGWDLARTAARCLTSARRWFCASRRDSYARSIAAAERLHVLIVARHGEAAV